MYYNNKKVLYDEINLIKNKKREEYILVRGYFRDYKDHTYFVDPILDEKEMNELEKIIQNHTNKKVFFWNGK
jgi:hypothetical protein